MILAQLPCTLPREYGGLYSGRILLKQSRFHGEAIPISSAFQIEAELITLPLEDYEREVISNNGKMEEKRVLLIKIHIYE